MDKKNKGSRITYFMIFAVLVGFAIILAMNAANFFGVMPSRYISPNDVRGVAVEHNGKLYTLNFQQQNEFINTLNRFIPVGKELLENRQIQVDHSPEVQKIIIYRFNAPNLDLIPVAYVSKSTSVMQNEAQINMVFSVPEWNKDGLLEESTGDELMDLLYSTYGP